MSNTEPDGAALITELAILRTRVAELEEQATKVQHLEAALRERAEEHEQLVATIRAISTPVIPVFDEIIVLPLVGTIDSARSAQIMETLLTGVQAFSAEFVIIDITGVPIVDTSVANHLLQAARAATLLGAQCVLVGISADVAQTIVQLGVNLSNITTCSNLQAGITFALQRQGRSVSERGDVQHDAVTFADLRR